MLNDDVIADHSLGNNKKEVVLVFALEFIPLKNVNFDW